MKGKEAATKKKSKRSTSKNDKDNKNGITSAGQLDGNGELNQPSPFNVDIPSRVAPLVKHAMKSFKREIFVWVIRLFLGECAEMQAIYHTHCLGQYRPIRAVRFIAENTVEERILQLQEKKKLVFDGTVGRDAGSLKMLTVYLHKAKMLKKFHRLLDGNMTVVLGSWVVLSVLKRYFKY